MKITAPHCLEWVNRSSPREVRGEGRRVVKSRKVKGGKVGRWVDRK